MVYEIDKDGMPTCGFAAESAKAGSKVKMIHWDFITPLNGPLFYEVLENLGSSYLPDDGMSRDHLQGSEKKGAPPTTDHCLPDFKLIS